MHDDELTFKEFVKKTSVRLLVGLMLICIVINVCRYIRVGLFIGDDTFVAKRDSEFYKGGKCEVKVDNQRNCINYQVTYGNMKKDMTLYWEGEKAILNFSDGKKITGYFKDGEIVDEDGDICYIDTNTYFNEGTQTESFPLNEYDLAVFACKAYNGEIQKYGSVQLYMWLIPILVFIFGMVCIYFPNKLNFFLSNKKQEDTELLEKKLRVKKLGGILLIIVGYAVIFLII